MAYLFGRTRSAADLSSGSLPDARLAASSVTQHESALESALDLEAIGPAGGNVAMGDNKITGLALCTANADAATKAYVDSVAQGLSAKDSVRIATSSSGDLSGYGWSGGTFTESSPTSGLTLQSTALADGDRVLVKNQSTGAQNGIYVFAANGSSACTLTRATDMDLAAEISAGAYFFVEEGTSADAGFVLTTDGAITVNSTALAFTQFSGAGQVTAGTGLLKSGNTLSASANLQAIHGLTAGDGNFVVGSGSTWVAESGATARTSLGLSIGSDVQAFDAQLADVAGLTPAAGKFIVGDGSNFVAESGSTARSSLGLGTAAIVDTGVSNAKVAIWDGSPTPGAFCKASSSGVQTATISTTDITASAVKASVTSLGGSHLTSSNSYTYTAGSADEVILIDSSIGGMSIGIVKLPTMSGSAGRRVMVKLKSGGSATGQVQAVESSGVTVDGASSVALGEANAAAIFISDGSNWYVF